MQKIRHVWIFEKNISSISHPHHFQKERTRDCENGRALKRNRADGYTINLNCRQFFIVAGTVSTLSIQDTLREEEKFDKASRFHAKMSRRVSRERRQRISITIPRVKVQSVVPSAPDRVTCMMSTLWHAARNPRHRIVVADIAL